LSDRCAIVTGAGRGIGRATSVRLARGGYDIVGVSRTASELAETRQQVEAAGATCVTICADLAEPASATRIVTQAREAFGRIDVLVNNAAVAPLTAVETLSDEALDRCLAVNVRAVVALTRAVWSTMRDGGGGVIVNLSSLASIDPFPGFAVYGGSKAFVSVFTQGLAHEGRADNIRVFAVAPGTVETSMLRSAFPDYPAEQCLSADQIAAQIEVLLDERNQFATGSTIQVKKE
jgi:short-subunit dehydrogenase